MKHILILLMLVPVLLLAQKSETPKVIKLPFYDAKLPTTDSTNVLWIDSSDFTGGALLQFENPDISIASYTVISSTKGEIFKMGGEGYTLPLQINWMLSRANIMHATVILHIEKIHLKGNLRTANWTYRIRVR